MGEVNRRNLESVLEKLMQDRGRAIKELEHVSVNGYRKTTTVKPEKIAMYEGAVSLFRQLPDDHPLKEQYKGEDLDVFVKMLGDDEVRFTTHKYLMKMRGYNVAVFNPCCVDRVAKEFGDFFTPLGGKCPEMPEPELKRGHPWRELEINSYWAENGVDDDNKPAGRYTFTYVGTRKEGHELGQVHVAISPPMHIDGLDGMLEKHGFISSQLVDDVFWDFGIPKNHRDYKMIEKGMIPVKSLVPACECPKSKIASAPGAEYALAMSHTYEFPEEEISSLQEVVDIAIADNASPGWKADTWKFALPSALSQFFIDHANHSAHDAMNKLGNPGDVEWHSYAFGAGGLTVAVLTCAYKESEYSSQIIVPGKIPLIDIKNMVMREIGIKSMMKDYQVCSMKEPGKDWQRKSAILSL